MGAKLIATLGLPASGKSTWAKGQVLAAPPGQVVRINKDLLREMLHADKFAGNKTESVTVQARDNLTHLFLTWGKTVIIDDTNFGHLEKLEDLARGHGAEFEVKDFTDVPLKACIERDLARPKSVGHKVINKMHRKFVAKQYEPPKFDPSLPTAILVDIDGTLAHGGGLRSPYDYDKVHLDIVDEVVRDLVTDAYCRGDIIIVLSGRKDSCRDATYKWLVDHKVNFNRLYMRAADDDREDSEVKGDLYDEHVAGKFNVRYVLDDRDRVVDEWRARGLKVLQCEPGDF
jgi:predicted kinase